jgi:voltage-gated potassium channel
MHTCQGTCKVYLLYGAIVDFVAIAPFFLPLIFTVDLRIMRLLRLLRIVRLLKLGRYSKDIQRIGHVFWEKKEELGVTLAFMTMLLVIMSTIMFYVEHVAQPEAFSSIPATMWWGLATLTTVGYGDMYPVTAIGKCIAGFFSLFGIAMFALPAGILSSGFSDMINGHDKE